MKFRYFADTDTLYVHIEHAGSKVDLDNLSFSALPFQPTKSA